MTTSRPMAGRRRDARWLLIGLAVSTVLFLLATSRQTPARPQIESPVPDARVVALGRPTPSTTTVRVNEYLRIDLRPGPADRYGIVLSGRRDADDVLQQLSGATTAPFFRALRTGTVLVTVLLEPHCPAEGVCREYRQDLGAVRVVITP